MLVNYVFYLSDEKMKLGVVYGCCKLRIDPKSLIHPSQKVFIESRRCDDVFSQYTAVVVNDVKIPVDGTVQAMAVLVMSFVALNLCHSVSYEDLLELMECSFGIRKRATKQKVRTLFSSI